MEVESKIENEISNELNIINEQEIEKAQNKFLESTVGKVVNTGVDIALRTMLPNAIEDEVIGIKNVILSDGIKNGVKAAVDSAINLGKSAVGIVTGKFENVSQAYTAIKSGRNNR